MADQSLEKAFHFLTSHEEGQSLILNRRSFSLYFSGIPSSGCHPLIERTVSSSYSSDEFWARMKVMAAQVFLWNTHKIMETINSARPEPKTDLVKQQRGQEPLHYKLLSEN